MSAFEASSLAPEILFARWLEQFGVAAEAQDVDSLLSLFGEDCYWKDLLSFTWQHRTFSGPKEVRDAFEATLAAVKPHNIRLAANRGKPRLLKRSSKEVLEGFFDFETSIGRGTAFVRLAYEPSDIGNTKIRLKVRLLLTTLQEIRGFEEKIGDRRPTGAEYSRNFSTRNWNDYRLQRRAFEDRDPEVLIIGGGHAGLMLAARLGQMDVDVLVVEKSAQSGDVWRNRYHSLTLHNKSAANHFPYMPFPATYPDWLPKDRLATWIASYVDALALNVWTSSKATSAEYDSRQKVWRTIIQMSNGVERTIQSKNLVVATGVTGSVPNLPDIAGLKDFSGEVMHSSKFKQGTEFTGRNVMVVGTGNSGHDIAQDLHVSGANVLMYQRSPTCVVSLEPSASMVYNVYSEGQSADDVDLLTAAIPYPVLKETYQFITKRSAEFDRELLRGLNAAGFETYFGTDDTGFHMLYLRGAGGYYIDVGCSDLISSGQIRVVQARSAERFVPNGLLLKDGTTISLDAVILATGFKNMQEDIRRLAGDEIANRVGPVWGFDEDYQMKNMWRQTSQDGLWIMGGSLLDARFHSRFLALEIKASLLGILPDRACKPLVARPLRVA